MSDVVILTDDDDVGAEIRAEALAEALAEEQRARARSRAVRAAVALALADAPDTTDTYTVVGGALARRVSDRDARHCPRLVWRDGRWQYVVSAAALTHWPIIGTPWADIQADVFAGELLVTFAPNGAVRDAYLVVADHDYPLSGATVRRTDEGELVFTLPGGAEVRRPDPRKR